MVSTKSAKTLEATVRKYIEIEVNPNVIILDK